MNMMKKQVNEVDDVVPDRVTVFKLVYKRRVLQFPMIELTMKDSFDSIDV